MAAFDIDDFLLIRKVDSYSEIRGIPIYMEDGRRMQCRVVRKHAQSYVDNVVLIVEVKVLKGILERTSYRAKELLKPLFNEQTGALKPLYSELVSGGFNCGSTIGSAGVVLGSAAAGPETLGSSWIVTALSWTNMTTSAALCGDNLGRLKIALEDAMKHNRVRDEIEELALLDNSDTYNAVKDTTEMVNLGAGVTKIVKYGFRQPLKSSYTYLKYARNLKGSKRLEPLRKELEKFKFSNTKAYNDTAKGILAKGRKGVGNSEMNKLIKMKKTQLKQLSFKNFMKDFANDMGSVVENVLKDKTPDMIKGAYNFINAETVVVTFHFVET